MEIVNGIPVWGEPDEGAVEQIVRCAEVDSCRGAALMADHHKGYSMPIGGVAAYEDRISPSGVGYDIACGNMAVRTNIIYDEQFKTALPGIMDRIQKEISFGVGRSNQDRSVEDHPIFDRPEWQDFKPVTSLKRKAADQLGTVGSGNHYVDILVDELNRVWIANHFGSRGFGHGVATGFLNLAQGLAWDGKAKESMDDPPTLIDTTTELGQAYLTYMQLAGEYAYVGRAYVINQVLNIIGAEVEDEVHVHHNYAWLENGLWVVRKGATPLHPGDRGYIGGSMGDLSAIVRGANFKSTFEQPDVGINETYRASINSAPHGAGRIMSRTKAAGKWVKRYKPKNLANPKAGMKKIRVRSGEGAISYEMMAEATKGIIVKGGGLDEAPQVYKDLVQVLEAHKNIVVETWLAPVGVVMASDDTFDPYQD